MPYQHACIHHACAHSHLHPHYPRLWSPTQKAASELVHTFSGGVLRGHLWPCLHLCGTQVVVEEERETPASWASVAAGLAHLAHGLAGAIGQEECSLADAERVFADADELLLLLEACPSDDARCV